MKLTIDIVGDRIFTLQQIRLHDESRFAWVAIQLNFDVALLRLLVEVVRYRSRASDDL